MPRPLTSTTSYESQTQLPVDWWFDNIYRDELGKEAFNETFDKILLTLQTADEKSAKVAKEGKTLHITLTYNWAQNDGYGVGVGLGGTEKGQILALL